MPDPDRRTNRRRLLAGLGAGLGAAIVPGAAFAQRAAVAAAAQAMAAVPIAVTAERIASFARTGGGNRRGRLEFRGGLVLASAHKDFGGLSGLVVAPDGRRLLAITDEGHWLAADLTYEGAAPSGLANARMGVLRAQNGRSLDRKKDADAEAITMLDGNLTTGTALIGFERNHRIGRFPIVGGQLQAPTGYLKMPAEARRMPANKGFEAVTIMAGGPLAGSPVAIAERFPDAQGHHSGWIWVRGEPQRFALREIGGFDVTDAAALPDGAVLILERRFRWTEGVRMQMRYLKPGVLVPGAVIEGEILITADMTSEIDNMEGLALHKGPRGETVLTLVSDDNFNHLLQRTILLQFTLLAEAGART